MGGRGVKMCQKLERQGGWGDNLLKQEEET